MHIMVCRKASFPCFPSANEPLRLSRRDTQVRPLTSIFSEHLLTLNRFVMNGLANANRILKEPVFNLDDWRVIGEYVFDKDGGRHQAFYSPSKNLNILGGLIKKDERVQVEQSLKYSPAEAQTLWKEAGLKEIGRWTATKAEYSGFHSIRVSTLLS